MKLFTLATLFLSLPVTSALAATYQVEGVINSSILGDIPSGATFRFSFDYDVATVGADTESVPWMGSYPNAFTNATLLIESPLTGSVLYTLGDTTMEVTTSEFDYNVSLGFNTFSPSADGLGFLGGYVNLMGLPVPGATDAAPVGFSAQGLTGGEVILTFDEGFGAPWYTTGSVNVATLVPEPSSALLLGSIGAFALLRRRRR
ncbi:MAG: PEP-CTERM sorting domain-containing protein [Verrucomicrobiaceae bacterium]|nr:MAG: PEP-CTERM sorting domain-containing protein [Verrucomicrobiaceae bacterium]